MPRIRLSLLILPLIALAVACLPAASYAGPMLEKGVSEYKSENYEEAVESLSAAKNVAEDAAVASYYLGLTLKQMGDFRGAALNFRESLQATPFVRDAYPEMIETLYTLNELKEAREWISSAENDGVSPGRIAFLKGLVLAKEEKNSAAIEAFGKAKSLDQSLSQAADFQIATLYAKDRKFKEAKESLRAVIALDPTSELASFAREYENAISKGLESYRSWKFSIGALYQYDDNVISKPGAAIGVDVVDRPVKGKSDSALVNTFRVDYSPLTSGPWSISAQYSLYNAAYSKLYEYDLFANSVSVIPAYSFNAGAVAVPVTLNAVWLNERQYMNVVSVKPTLSMIIVPGHIGQLFAGYGKREMLNTIYSPDEDRDANIFSAGAGYIYPFSEGRGVFNLKYEFTKENTDGINWDNVSNRISASLLWPLASKLRLALSADINIQDYKHVDTKSGTVSAEGSEPFGDHPAKRRDRIYSGSAALTWELIKKLNLIVSYSHTSADSNFSIYDYSRNLYLAGLEYNF